MKEILKYLRQLNSFSQEEISKKLGISRQSYIKYENGSVLPSEKIVEKLSSIYSVSKEFIYQNKIPNAENGFEYKMNHKDSVLKVAESKPSYQSSKKYYEGIFDGKSVQFLDNVSLLGIQKGQKFKLFIEEDDSEEREKAFQTIMSYRGTLPKDFDYKKALYEALEEKYGPFN